MANTVMLNVRMDRGLKNAGESVLARAGLTATKAIRSLYRTMAETGEVPSCCADGALEQTTESRRFAMRELVGIAPLKPGEDAETLKAERLNRHNFADAL